MSYMLDFTDVAKKNIEALKKSGDKITLNKLKKLLEELTEHPYTGTGKPEQLKHEYSGYYSRRITQKHRLIYSVDDNRIIVLILTVLGHYEDR